MAGIGWETDLPRLQEFLATPDFESADAWSKAHEADNFGHYGTSKQAINAYVATHAFPFLAKGIRINAICPGPTDTPLARANADLWLSFAQDYREATGTATHTPEQMGNVMAFLNSDAAAGVNGVTLLVDYGHVNSSNTGTFARASRSSTCLWAGSRWARPSRTFSPEDARRLIEKACETNLRGLGGAR